MFGVIDGVDIQFQSLRFNKKCLQRPVAINKGAILGYINQVAQGSMLDF